MDMLFKYQDEKLYWNDFDLSLLPELYGTPVHILNFQALEKSINEFLSPFTKEQLPVKCYYSVKSNPVPEMLLYLKQKGIGVEISSEYEMWLSKSLGFKGDDIILSGSAKSKKLLSDAVDYNVKMLVVESMNEFNALGSVMKIGTESVNIGIRFCPNLSTNRFNHTLNTASKNSPYGFLSNSEEFYSLLKNIRQKDYLNFMGFHIHLGSGIQSSRPYKKALSLLEELIKTAGKYDCKSKLIDIGGGFGSVYTPVYTLFQLLSSFAFGNSQIKIKQRNELLLKSIAKDLSKMLIRLNQTGYSIDKIITEPGRRLSGSAQITLLSVLDVIKRKDGRCFIICDGGAMSLSPMLLTQRHQVLPLRRRGEKHYNYTILGNLPSSLDRISHSISMTEIRVDDWIAILDTGAYFIPFSTNFGGPRPAIAMIDNGRSKLIRRREDFHDLIGNDLYFKTIR